MGKGWFGGYRDAIARRVSVVMVRAQMRSSGDWRNVIRGLVLLL